MVEALEHVANLERPAKRCRLVERHRDASLNPYERQPIHLILTKDSLLIKCLLKGASSLNPYESDDEK